MASRARVAALRDSLRSTRHTVMADVFERPAPSPREFAHHGDGTWIVPPCEVIGPLRISIGENAVVLEHSSIRALDGDNGADPTIVLGDRVRLGRFTTIACEVSVILENDVSGSDFVAIRDTWRDFASPPNGLGGLGQPGPQAVHVGRGAYLGYGCLVGPGVSVGEGAFVGEGAVVLADVEPFTVVYGNPARQVRRYDRATATWVGSRWP